MNTLGFLYVNIANMNCSRRSLLFSSHESRADFYKTVFFSPLLFFFGNNIALRSQQDLSSIGVEYSYWECLQYSATFWTLAYIVGL